MEIVLTDGHLMGVASELNTTGEMDSRLRYTLNIMERKLRDINTTVAHKQQLINEHHISGFAGSIYTLLLSLFHINYNGKYFTL